jgi:polar amino acid transport system substrate-binding protein
MNDHIPKPVDRRQLLAALCQWIKPGQHERPVQLRQAQPSCSMQFLHHLHGINSRAALERIGGNQRIYCSILRKFASEHTNAAEEIRSLLAQDERRSAERLAHTLKGMAGAIGAEDLQETARLLEDGIRRHAALAPLLGAVEEQLRQTAAAIQHHLPPLENEAPEAAPIQVKETLLLLQKQLGNYEAGAVDTLTELLGLNLPPELRQRLLALQQPIEQFDAEGALTLLEDFPELKEK